MSRLTTSFLALFALLLTNAVNAVNTIEMRGQQLVDSETNERFYLIGVDYQPGGQAGYKPQDEQDALSNGTVCLRDAALIQSLGLNTIRVYNIAPEINHDECMSYFNAAGIYVLLDVNAPFAGESLDRSDPGPSYTASYLRRIFSVVEAFKNFPNVLGFFAANEVMNDEGTAEENPPYIRAIQRDLKQYIANHGGRSFPVGYSAADVRPILQDTWNYFQCDISSESDSDSSRADIFGLNSYSWCGDVNTFDTSGYDDLANMFRSSSIPVFFSEYGCNEVKPRTFPEVPSLYGENMTMLSGGMVYEYSQEDADFGLVNINDNGTVTLRIDFDNLQKQYNSLDLDLLKSTNSRAEDINPPRCSSSLITSSSFSKSFNIPNTPRGGSDLINNGVSNAPSGKLVDVSDNLQVPMAIYAVDGSQLPQLSIKPVSDSNTPSGQTTNNGTSTGSGSAPKENGAAARVGAGVAETLGVAAALAILASIW